MATRGTGIFMAAGVLVVAGVLAGCSSDHSPTAHTTAEASAGGMDHPMDGGPVPAGMKAATDPEYPVGAKVVLTADHMDGMEGAPATVVGAFDTFTYAVDFTPTTGGESVTDHRWVVQQELRDVGDQRLADGAAVVLEADHMEGMEGAKATISSSTDETVYVVDYTADGMTMTNHQWVTESEMKPSS